MPETTTFVITNAGRAAIVNATHTGTRDLTLTHVAYGRGGYTPNANMTGLVDEIKRVPCQFGGNAGDGIINVTAIDSSSDAYAAVEVGIYAHVESTGQDLLFAIYSNPESQPVIEKTALSQSAITFSVFIGTDEAETIDWGDMVMFNPPATTETEGVMALATVDEMMVATVGNKAVTPSVAYQALFEKAGVDNRFLKRIQEISKSKAQEAIEENDTTSVIFSDEKPLEEDVEPNHIYAYPADGNFNTGDDDDSNLNIQLADKAPSNPEELEDGQGVVYPATDLL